MVELERLEIVHQPVAHQYGLGVHELPQLGLCVGERGGDAFEIFRLQAGDVRLVVDDLTRWLDQGLEEHVALLVHHGHADERPRVRVGLAHLAVHAEHLRRRALLLAPPRGPLLLAPRPLLVVGWELGVLLLVVGVRGGTADEGPRAGLWPLVFVLVVLPARPLVPARCPSRPAEMATGGGGPLLLALAGDEVEHEIGQGAPLVLSGIVLGLQRSLLRRLEPCLEVALRGSGIGCLSCCRGEPSFCDGEMPRLTLSPWAPLATSSFTSRTRHSLSASVNSTSIVCSLFCPMACCLQRSGASV